MKIQGNQNFFATLSQAANRSAQHTAKAQGRQTENKDMVHFGQQNQSNIIQMLQEKKQNLIDKRNQLVEQVQHDTTLKDTLSEQIKLLNQQIVDVDKQMQRQMYDEAKKSISDLEKNTYQKPKTKEEAETSQMHSLLDASNRVDLAEDVSATQRKTEGQKAVLDDEIAADASSVSNVTLDTKTDASIDCETTSYEMAQDGGKRLDKINKALAQAAEDAAKAEDSTQTQETETLTAKEQAEQQRASIEKELAKQEPTPEEIAKQQAEANGANVTEEE